MNNEVNTGLVGSNVSRNHGYMHPVPQVLHSALFRLQAPDVDRQVAFAMPSLRIIALHLLLVLLAFTKLRALLFP